MTNGSNNCLDLTVDYVDVHEDDVPLDRRNRIAYLDESIGRMLPFGTFILFSIIVIDLINKNI
ncbi:hypothetical protein BLOT_012576 [Blomia tropicalis]|nr:hypothetical protein BLOT_012576 [Blomia tropicalis]